MRFLYILVATVIGGMFVILYASQLLMQKQITVGGESYGGKKTLRGNLAWLIGISLVLSSLLMLVGGIIDLLNSDSIYFIYIGDLGGIILFNIIGVFLSTGDS